MALIYESQGRYAEAELFYMRALKLSQHLLGHEHPHVAQCLFNLALFYDSQGCYIKIEPLYLQALEIREQCLGVNHPNTILVRENLAILRDRLTPNPE